MKKFLIILLVVVLLIAGSVYYFLFTTKSVDVTWTEKDYQSYLQKVSALDTENESTSNATKNDSTATQSGTEKKSGATVKKSSKPFPLDTSFTNAEISAMLSKECERTNGPIKNVNVRFLPNNELEASFVTSENIKQYIPKDQLEKFKIAENIIANRPVYVKMQIEKTSAKTISLNLENANVGRIGVPNSALKSAESAIVSAANTQLQKLTNFSMDQLNFNDNSAYFKGNLQSAPRKLD